MGFEINDVESLDLSEKFPGLEVVVKVATTFEEFETMQRIGTAGMGADMDGALREFGDKFLDSWNATSRGTDLPADGDGFSRASLPVKFAILSAWLDLMRGPSAPLEQESSSGLDSPEDSTTEPDSE